MVRANGARILCICFMLSGMRGENASMLKRMHKNPGAEKCREIAVFVRKQEKQCILICKKYRGNKSVGDRDCRGWAASEIF